MALFKAVVWALIFLTKLRFPPRVCIAIVPIRYIKDLPEENFKQTNHELDSFLQQQSLCVLKPKGHELVI